jgi:hypothetical protein
VSASQRNLVSEKRVAEETCSHVMIIMKELVTGQDTLVP